MTVADAPHPVELSLSLDPKTIQCYGPCGTFFGNFHTGTDSTAYFEVRCRNKRCLRDGYVTYHRWDADPASGCSTRREPKQYAEPEGAVDIMKGTSHVRS